MLSNMFFSTLLAGAGLVTVAFSAPLDKRQTPASCTQFANGALAVFPKGSNENVTWVGIVDGVTHVGINDQQASILVTKDDNGQPLAPQQWEFWRCTDQDDQPIPNDGVTFGGSAHEIRYFGIVRPSGATQHCLAVESETDSQTGDTNSVLDSRCTDIPEQYRTWYYHSIAASGSTKYLRFADEEMNIYISDTKHAELQFVNNGSLDGKQQMDLRLTDPRQHS